MPDLYSKEEATLLAMSITTHWQGLGYPNVRAERFEVEGIPDHWGVRSNLVNGLPPGKSMQDRRREFLG